jgi:hypothetical protein
LGVHEPKVELGLGVALVGKGAQESY